MVMAGRQALSGAGNMKYIFYNIIVSGHELICGLMRVAEVGRERSEMQGICSYISQSVFNMLALLYRNIFIYALCAEYLYVNVCELLYIREIS